MSRRRKGSSGDVYKDVLTIRGGVGRQAEPEDAAEYAAALLYNHSTQDWRRVIPRITLPTLVVGGKVSVVPWKSQVWIQKQVRGSKIEIFEESEGGNHFMFMENPDKFNRIVRDFMG